jgi:hypothetical protein
MLDKTAGWSSPLFREALEKDARELTRLGNDLQIRHSETDREPVSERRLIPLSQVSLACGWFAPHNGAWPGDMPP